jgi:hypothetical protein
MPSRSRSLKASTQRTTAPHPGAVVAPDTLTHRGRVERRHIAGINPLLAIAPPAGAHRTPARPRCRNRPLRLRPLWESRLTSKRAAAEIPDSGLGLDRATHPRGKHERATNPLHPRLAAAYERSEFRPRGNSTALEANPSRHGPQQCDHRMTAHSFRSQAATPEAINDHESGIAVRPILAATKRKRHRNEISRWRDGKIISGASRLTCKSTGFGGLVGFRRTPAMREE